jgi:hypothetical protein
VGQFSIIQLETLPGGFTWLDLHFGIFLRGLGGHFQRGRILGLLQPVRAHCAREIITFQLGYELVHLGFWSIALRGFWKPGSSSILYLGGFIILTLYSLYLF